MKSILTLLLASLMALPASVFAHDDDDDDDYRDYYHHREYKEKFRDGPCKVERKYKRNGDYEEKRKCRGDDYRDDYYSGPPQQPLGDLGGIVRLLDNL
ncbi:membrane lipoprotein, cell wall extensin motif [Advenella kashmirensis W13003]|uniref:Membrane lipoprotein, cell wall extensin motif n=1 Tax=Advenella kashmirensis W13003 TaxID=1424334 RepID=V8QN90_9BURK|nr:hypothetical protein [Advenella kashmirensis]ETF01102.1 membrane lipoprotein, cell wall extensin motif [Advenella kashmirensis W13003]